MKSGVYHNFSLTNCDLCGNPSQTVLLEKSHPISILSDNSTVSIALRKVECSSCELVRDGHEITAEYLTGLYQFDYILNLGANEYHFLTRQGAIPRSKAFFDWIWSELGSYSAADFRKVLEIGCSAGHLYQRMESALPHAVFLGTELSEEARNIAMKKGGRILLGGVEKVEDADFDFIYSVGVLEHVPQPGLFLQAIRDRLSPDGILILIQPTQDVPSSDIYFTDHLHHFGTNHLSMYAQKIGFTEVVKSVGYPLMPNFSLHLWRRGEPSADYIFQGKTQCRESIAYHEAMYEEVNRLVDEIQLDPSRKLAVFGLNERFALLRAYSRLGEARIVCGLSDVEPNVKVDFPVVKPERAGEFSATDVILCINQIHRDFVSERLSLLGVKVHAT